MGLFDLYILVFNTKAQIVSEARMNVINVFQRKRRGMQWLQKAGEWQIQWGKTLRLVIVRHVYCIYLWVHWKHIFVVAAVRKDASQMEAIKKGQSHEHNAISELHGLSLLPLLKVGRCFHVIRFRNFTQWKRKMKKSQKQSRRRLYILVLSGGVSQVQGFSAAQIWPSFHSVVNSLSFWPGNDTIAHIA